MMKFSDIITIVHGPYYDFQVSSVNTSTFTIPFSHYLISYDSIFIASLGILLCLHKRFGLSAMVKTQKQEGCEFNIS